jgi:lysophospholipase L1-like esterase
MTRQVTPGVSQAAADAERASMSHSPRRRWLFRIGFATGALMLSLLILESASRFFLNQQGKHYGIEMWKYARELKQRSDIAAMSHEHRPHSAATIMGAYVEINSMGLRDREFEIKKPTGTYRILVLGDSITFGFGVEPQHAFCEVLERRLNVEIAPGLRNKRFEVINSGVGNYNTAQEVAYFTHRGQILNPDLVLLAFYVNDAEPTPKPKTNPLAKHSYFYVASMSALDAVLRRIGAQEDFTEYYLNLYRDGAAGWMQCQLALEQLATSCRNRGVPAMIVLIPELHDTSTNYPFGEIHDKVATVAANHGLVTLDLREAFRGIEPMSLWVSPGDAHPNAKGHLIIAQAIFNEVAPLVAHP